MQHSLDYITARCKKFRIACCQRLCSCRSTMGCSRTNRSFRMDSYLLISGAIPRSIVKLFHICTYWPIKVISPYYHSNEYILSSNLQLNYWLYELCISCKKISEFLFYFLDNGYLVGKKTKYIVFSSKQWV